MVVTTGAVSIVFLSMDPNSHDDAPAWGAYRLRGMAATLTAATRAVPGWPLVKQLAFPLRRLARRFMHGPVDDRL